MTDFIVSPIIIFLNVTVLQGCNYAPVGEVCAPQYDMPHWYTGKPYSFTYSYGVELFSEERITYDVMIKRYLEKTGCSFISPCFVSNYNEVYLK